MMVNFTGPRGGKLDEGLKTYAYCAMNSFAKQLGINRLKICYQVNLHHGLYTDNSHGSEGLCLSLDQRNFEVDVALYGNWLVTLAHEMVHVKQFARGELDSGLTRWKSRSHANTEYADQPWEKEARKLQYKLVAKFMEELGE